MNKLIIYPKNFMECVQKKESFKFKSNKFVWDWRGVTQEDEDNEEDIPDEKIF